MAVVVKIPDQAEVTVTFQISAKANITPFGAKQEVDDFLLDAVGNLLCAGEPELFVAEEGMYWRVPVHYVLPSKGKVGRVGALLVDVQTGEMVRTLEELDAIKRHAEVLYQAATSAAG